MLVRGLWGIQIGPQSDQIIKVEASFRITMASIFKFNGPERTSVYVRFQDSTFLLCSLIPEKIEQQVVDITCLQGEEITLRVDGPNVIHLLGNYISQDGIDDQKDDEIGFLEMNGSDVDDPADTMLEKTAPSIAFPAERKGLGFDESDEFDSTSESQTESEAESDMASESESESESESDTMPCYNVARLGSYADRSTSTTSSLGTSKNMADHASPVSNAEGAGRYVLINGNASVCSSTEPFDQQSNISGAVANQASLSDSQHHATEAEEQDNADMDSQAKQVTKDIESRSEHKAEQEPQHESYYESRLESKQASEQISDYALELESDNALELGLQQVSEYEPEQEPKQESENESDCESKQESKQEPSHKPQQKARHEQEHESEHKAEKEAEQESKPMAEPTSESTPEPTQQITPEPAMKLTLKPGQSTQVDNNTTMSAKQKKTKRKSGSIPTNTPSPLKKKANKAAKKQAKELTAALAKQQELKCDSSKDEKKQKKAQESKEKSKIKAKKISKKKQALASNSQPDSQNKSTKGSSQDIRNLVLGAFANMAAAIQSAATVEPKPSPAPKFKKLEVEEINQDVIPNVVAGSAVKSKGKPRKPKAPTTLAVSQNDQTQNLGTNDLGTIPSTLPKKRKKLAKRANATQNDASAAARPIATDLSAATPVPIEVPTVSPVAISVPGSSKSSPASGNEFLRVRYPRKAVGTDSMQKLALFAQEDAKSADNVRKERKKKKSLRADEAVSKKARLSI